jgi:hypothetical protein
LSDLDSLSDVEVSGGDSEEEADAVPLPVDNTLPEEETENEIQSMLIL